MRDGCVFCDYEGPSPVLRHYTGAYVIEPVEPVTRGHVLVVPYQHVSNFADFNSGTYRVVAATFEAAAAYAHVLGECNLIVSRGRAATQTVDHLHVHLVPRREGDGLKLPWSP